MPSLFWSFHKTYGKIKNIANARISLKKTYSEIELISYRKFIEHTLIQYIKSDSNILRNIGKSYHNVMNDTVLGMKYF